MSPRRRRSDRSGALNAAPGRARCDTGRLIVVAGPTGTGKSDLGLDLAERLGGEVVNADSMQLYRGMDIGTAKVPVDQRRGVPHHLLDVLDVTQTASVAAYQRQARAVVEDIRARGKTAIVVGGSGLYVQAIVDDIDFPATDPQVRARLQAELDALGTDALFRRLRASGPGGRGGHRTRQRASDRPGAGGHRDHRPAVHRVACRSRDRPATGRCW